MQGWKKRALFVDRFVVSSFEIALKLRGQQQFCLLLCCAHVLSWTLQVQPALEPEGRLEADSSCSVP
ncbi:hypothetical protein MHYP_G00181220 [Metynnis hypsauchen]